MCSGKSGEDEGSGSITIPEVAHDTEIDEYVVCHPEYCWFLLSCR
jgi:hypothetical protein